MANVDEQFDELNGKKKSNKNLFIGLGIACVIIVIAVVALILNKDNITSMLGGDKVETVGSQVITKRDYKAITVLQVLQYEQQSGSPIWDQKQNGSSLIDQAKAAALSYLTTEKVQVLKANQKNIKLTSAEKKTLDTSYSKFLTQYKTSYGSYYTDALTRIDITEKDFNAAIKDFLSESMLVQKLKEDAVAGYKAPDLIKAQHILITFQKHKNNDAATKAIAQSVLDKIKAGQDFSELAKKYSEDTGSAVAGGDLGYFGKGQMVKPFEAAAYALKKPGDVSGLVKSTYGYHIIKLEAKGFDGSKLSEADRKNFISTSQNFATYYQSLVAGWQKKTTIKTYNTELPIKAGTSTGSTGSGAGTTNNASTGTTGTTNNSSTGTKSNTTTK